MTIGAFSGLLVALLIFAASYMQAANDRELFGATDLAIRMNKLPTSITIIVCVVVGALIGAAYG